MCPVVGSWPGKDFTTKAAGVLESELTAAGIPHDLKVYPGAKHAFFNDQCTPITPPRQPTPGSGSWLFSPSTSVNDRRDPGWVAPSGAPACLPSGWPERAGRHGSWVRAGQHRSPRLQFLPVR
jgi:dienelactone hydrolase